MRNAVTGQGMLKSEILSQLCVFCKEGVDDGNFVVIQQVMYAGEEKGGLVTSQGEGVVVMHQACGLPQGKTLRIEDDPDSDPLFPDEADDDETTHG
jgi:hypothetical protein